MFPTASHEASPEKWLITTSVVELVQAIADSHRMILDCITYGAAQKGCNMANQLIFLGVQIVKRKQGPKSRTHDPLLQTILGVNGTEKAVRNVFPIENHESIHKISRHLLSAWVLEPFSAN